MPGVAYVSGQVWTGGSVRELFALGTIVSDNLCYFNDVKQYRCDVNGGNLQVLNKKNHWVKSSNIQNIAIKEFNVLGSIGGNGSVAPWANIETAVQWCIDIANDNTHGYDQQYREGPNYDCSSLVCSGLNHAGFDVGLPGTSEMVGVLTGVGFSYHAGWGNTADNLIRGDILITPGQHTEFYIGGGQNVGAHSNEFGGIVGGRSGDQTGNEISVTAYYSLPWAGVLRYEE